MRCVEAHGGDIPRDISAPPLKRKHFALSAVASSNLDDAACGPCCGFAERQIPTVWNYRPCDTRGNSAVGVRLFPVLKTGKSLSLSAREVIEPEGSVRHVFRFMERALRGSDGSSDSRRNLKIPCKESLWRVITQ